MTLDMLASWCRGTATHLRQRVLPQLQGQSQLFLVSIGTVETGIMFAEKTDFPKRQLFADPDNAAYDALQLNSGMFVTYLTPLVRLPGEC
jgi:peroxiredoxin